MCNKQVTTDNMLKKNYTCTLITINQLTESEFNGLKKSYIADERPSDGNKVSLITITR